METTPQLNEAGEGGSQHPLVRHLTAQERDDLLALLFAATRSTEDLIESSRGVAGLHLNGDDAPWSDLVEGGCYEEWMAEHTRGVRMMDELCAKYLANAEPTDR